MGEPVWALGLMSGTAMDGVDAALVLTDGVGIAEFGPAAGFSYAPGEMDATRAVHGDWRRFRPPAGASDAAVLARAGAEVVATHAAAAARLLAAPGAPGADIVGFHGQTVAHAPHEGWTWQLGDGAALARALNRPVVWDFRSADMAAGGEGAPLAPFFHHALARRMGATAPVAFLNLGGVGNVTWVDPGVAAPEAPGALLAFDTGPGNALIDDWMMRRTGVGIDRDGRAAAAGRVHEGRLRRTSIAAYLDREPPKSLDRNDFSQVLAAMEGLSAEDGAATLSALSAICVAAAQDRMPRPPARWLVCGGGRRNPTLMAMLAARLAAPVAAVEDAGFDGDMLEAQAFACLAVRARRGLPLSAPGTTGCRAPATGGRVSGG